jgi:transposase InsO family protein
MDARRRLVSWVRDGRSVSAVARELGVSRQTAYVWLRRADEDGLEGLAERSRRPACSPQACSSEIEQSILLACSQYPFWGARKLHALLWPAGSAPICARTVGRVLARHGHRASPSSASAPETQRFERAVPNELWQADFKKLGPRRNRVETFNVLDDASRFCVLSQVVPNQTLDSLWSVLWQAFEQYGLPLAILTDNGPAFRSNATWRWSSFDLRLLLLGIRPCHGRPYHPQTQGKVERFHGTLQRELGVAFEHEDDLSQFRLRYNWVRPHEALQMKTPGTLYVPFLEKDRP